MHLFFYFYFILVCSALSGLGGLSVPLPVHNMLVCLALKAHAFAEGVLWVSKDTQAREEKLCSHEKSSL